MNDKALTLPDGSVVPLMPANFNFSLKVSLDDEVMDLGLAYRMLLTYREWAAEEIERLNTALADWRAHEAHCPLAQQEKE